MRMTKSLVICFLAMFIVLAGCGKGGSTAASPSAAATEAPAAKTVAPDAAATPAPATPAPATPAPATPAPAGPVSIIAYAAEPDKTAENENLAARIKRFTAKNPNVTITPKFWKYQNTEVAIKMASNSAQTEFTTWATEAKLLSGKKWIIDLTDSLASWQYAKDLNEIAMKPFIIEGKTYGIPLDAYGMTITINKKIFAAKGVALPPLDWTWDDLLAAAKAVNDPGKVAGFIPMGKGTEAGWNWTNYLYSAGGDVETVAGGKVTAAFNSAEGLKALQFYKDLKDANVIPKNWALGYGDALTLFNQGRGAMVMCGSGNAVENAINQGGILKKEDVAIYPIPSVTKGGKHYGVAGGNYKVINGLATPEQQKAAFNFTVDELFTDDYLNAIDKQITEQVAKKQVFVPQLINYWNASSEYEKKFQAMLAKHDNVYKIAPELLGLIEPHTEATYEAQAYYLEMSNVIQKVFTSKGPLDLKKLLDDAAAKLQTASFDKVKIG